MAKQPATPDPFATADGRKMISGRAPLSKFVPSPENPRTHSPEQIAILADLLIRYGPDQPIVVDEDWVILKGHGRREGAIKAGLPDFPYVQRFGLTQAEKEAIRIEDNQSALLAGWSIPLVRQSIVRLQGFNYDISRLGFGDIQLKDWGIGIADLGQMPVLPTGERSPFQQMTFILHASQVLIVNEAIALAMAQVKKSKRNSDNRNKNGLALVAICRSFIASRPRPKQKPKKKNARRAKR